jgi:long-chain acyl-CoA synthetase
MPTDFLKSAFHRNKDKVAIVWGDRAYQYSWLLERVRYWERWIDLNRIPPGAVVGLEGDFSPNGIALFLALLGRRCVLVPLSSSLGPQVTEFKNVAETELSFVLDERDDVNTVSHSREATHPLYQELRRLRHPGLVLFSSGSTGSCKAVVHDMVRVLMKFRVGRPSFRAITFLLYDHIGGVNTMLHILSNGGCAVTVGDRSPDTVLAAISRHQVDLLPTSPTFINLLLLTEAYERHDISCLKTVTYGTEPMPMATLRRFHRLFPGVRLLQTYGLSELGILRSKSRSSDSLWMKVGGEGFETKVVDGMLAIKAESAMLGYLNAPSPFSEDGWFLTGDLVEVDGDYFKILGRASESINVGGQKVHPVEVESVIQGMKNVAESTVFAEPNAIVGQVVCTRVRLVHEEDPKKFARRLKKHCSDRLERYKVPVKVTLDDTPQHGPRLKKRRRGTRGEYGEAEGHSAPLRRKPT